jgi:hypothetical protein
MAKHSAFGVWPVQFGFEQVHGLEEGLLFARGELVRDAGKRLGQGPMPLRCRYAARRRSGAWIAGRLRGEPAWQVDISDRSCSAPSRSVRSVSGQWKPLAAAPCRACPPACQEPVREMTSEPSADWRGGYEDPRLTSGPPAGQACQLASAGPKLSLIATVTVREMPNSLTMRLMITPLPWI